MTGYLSGITIVGTFRVSGDFHGKSFDIHSKYFFINTNVGLDYTSQVYGEACCFSNNERVVAIIGAN